MWPASPPLSLRFHGHVRRPIRTGSDRDAPYPRSMSDFTVLVTGARGKIGRRVAAAARARGWQVREGSRAGGPAFDLADPDSWPALLDGADAVFLLLPEGVAADPRFVEQAAAGRRLVLLSSRGIEEMGDRRLLEAEELVRGTARSWTILRPDWLNQNFSEGIFADSVRNGMLSLPVGAARFAFIDTADLGEAAAAALDPQGGAAGTLELTGPEALSFGQACAVLAAASGRPVAFDGSADTYRRGLLADGAPNEAVEAALAAFSALSDGTGPTSTLPELTGRPGISFSAFAAAAAAAGAWR